VKKKIKSEVLRFKCSLELKQKIEHMADRLNVPVSEFMRDSLSRSVGAIQDRINRGETISLYKYTPKTTEVPNE
jgi:predicted transcriptional regulator